jgi:hypothetical protein
MWNYGNKISIHLYFLLMCINSVDVLAQKETAEFSQ